MPEPAELYALAQRRAHAGDPQQALALIDEAEVGFRAVGDELGAARCDAGRSNVLEDLGRHAEAVTAARRWLAWLQAEGDDEHRDLLAQAHANLGSHLEDAGRYVEALAAHDAAIALAGSLGEVVMAAEMEVNRANVRNLLGRSRDALVGLERAAAVLESAGDDDRRGLVAISIGETLCRMGRPDEGLHWFARAERAIAPGSPEHPVLVVETADALAALGAFDEAAQRYAEAFQALAVTPLAWLAVRAWTGAGSVAAARGRTAEAAGAFAAASQLHLAADNLPGWAVAASEALALTSAEQPGRQERIDALLAAVGDLDAPRWPVQACRVHLNLARLAANDAAAERHLRTAVALAARSGVPHLVVQAGQRLGALLARTGRLDDAGPTLEGVLATADHVRGRLHTDQLLRTFPATVVAAHEALVDVRIAQGRIDEALARADAGRSRAIVELGRARRPSARRPELEQVDDELAAIYDRLLDLDGPVDPDWRRRLDARAAVLEARLDRLELDAGTGPPRRRAGSALPAVGDDEAEVVYHVTDGRIGAFVRDRSGTTFVPDLAALDAVTEELERFHSLGRRALAVAGSGHIARLGDAARAVLRRLGSHLLGPLDLGAAGRLVVVPHGVLHGVPFHALEVGGRALFEAVEVVVSPSLAARADRPAPASGPTVIVGCGAPDLPGVGAELDALQALLPDAVVLRDEAATVGAVTASIAGAGCVHLASHGLFRAGAPMSGGIRLADGWLTARQTAALDLDGALVVLSACDTGRSVVHAGDELLGVQRGFLLAGARSVVMSHWAAVDDAVVVTMAELHRRVLAGAAVPAALRAGWAATRAAHPHPWWWGPFFATSA